MVNLINVIRLGYRVILELEFVVVIKLNKHGLSIKMSSLTTKKIDTWLNLISCHFYFLNCIPYQLENIPFLIFYHNVIIKFPFA